MHAAIIIIHIMLLIQFIYYNNILFLVHVHVAATIVGGLCGVIVVFLLVVIVSITLFLALKRLRGKGKFTFTCTCIYTYKLNLVQETLLQFNSRLR